ncbi:MAG: helix-hairpin-helix domain-containing protein [Bacteroides thetaiotaomicron]
MASNIEFVEFVCSQLRELGHIRYRKMFGDYMIYVNEKTVILLCDNIAYVKILPEIEALMSEAETGIPYEGAKPHYIVDVEHKDILMKVVKQIENLLPYPKEKAPKKKTVNNDVHPYLHLPNIGQQTEQDLLQMGYTSLGSLKGKSPEELYQQECEMKGCIVDRCQLYVYRALIYYIESDKPDKEKSKWWYWKDDYCDPSPCGAKCIDCPSFPNECKGCKKIKGKVFWLQYTGDDICPIWKCCKEEKRKNCGGCPHLPCSRFMKDPSISDEENDRNLKRMIDNLSKVNS